ncbi:bacteriophage abortive infection AbiH family protein [Pedobacter sp. ASV1-7]|uniref:bacteriophage abortive infection AbiH family protein n=1 Tax=Pedobacter sp. ASV1-7 TaxID=3145237 RepID=UPI0032E87E36
MRSKINAMNNSILYIIGNGFDLYHGIPSSYWHFRNYVEQKNTELFDALERYFNPDQLWSDFEATLAELDTDYILDEAANYLESYGTENWSDAFHHDYQYEIGERIKLVTTELKAIFTEWILSLEIPSYRDDMLKINREAIFMNFNYTPTLTRLYKVHKANITYIHNEAESEDSVLLLGHCINPDPLPQRGTEDEDVRITEGQQIIDQYFLDSYKQVGNIITEKQKFFEELAKIEEINVFGHSMADVDLPYFEEIIKHLNVSKVKWHVSYFKPEEYEQRLHTLISLGIPEGNIIVEKLENFDSGQLSLL